LALTGGKNKEWLQQTSLDTWILMESCKKSARENKKISIKSLKENFFKS
jgi:hypothetical protein